MLPDDNEAGVASGDDAVGGGRPRRESDVTVYPSNKARRQIVWPKNPVPPSTSNLPRSTLLVAGDEDDDDDDAMCNHRAPTCRDNAPCRREGVRANPFTLAPPNDDTKPAITASIIVALVRVDFHLPPPLETDIMNMYSLLKRHKGLRLKCYYFRESSALTFVRSFVRSFARIRQRTIRVRYFGTKIQSTTRSNKIDRIKRSTQAMAQATEHKATYS